MEKYDALVEVHAKIRDLPRHITREDMWAEVDEIARMVNRFLCVELYRQPAVNVVRAALVTYSERDGQLFVDAMALMEITVSDANYLTALDYIAAIYMGVSRLKEALIMKEKRLVDCARAPDGV